MIEEVEEVSDKAIRKDCVKKLGREIALMIPCSIVGGRHKRNLIRENGGTESGAGRRNHRNLHHTRCRMGVARLTLNQRAWRGAI